MGCSLVMQITNRNSNADDVNVIFCYTVNFRRFASFSASSELPYDVEDAMLFWINKVCGVIRYQLEKNFRGQLPDDQPKVCITIISIFRALLQFLCQVSWLVGL